jgi:hypothetical protein
MKIGILTLHRGINDGSVLQAYCLQRLLETMFPGSRIELVDIRPWNVEKRELRKTIQKNFPFVRIHNWNRRKHLLHFLYSQCNFSPTSCTTNHVREAERFIEKQNYNVIVVGSDTVWQVPSPKLPPNQEIPNIFFLPHLKNVKKVAFAPSADQFNVSILNQNHYRENLHSSINDFDFISYRDESAEILLSELNIPKNNYQFVADPSILWDFSSLVKPEGMDLTNKHSLAGISLAQEAVKVETTRWFRANGYDVVNFLGDFVEGQTPPPRNFYKSFAQRLFFSQHLEVLITDRFHGSISALKLSGCPVIFVEPTDKYRYSISKGRDLFRRLGFEKMVWQYSPESDGKIPIDKYLQIWKDLQVHPQEAINKMKQSCQNALENLRAKIAGT